MMGCVSHVCLCVSIKVGIVGNNDELISCKEGSHFCSLIS